MSPSDLDRRLREWLEPGVDHARESVIWDVIDQVENTAQRPRWTGRFIALLDRIGPMLPPIGVAAVVLAAVVLGAALSGRDVGQPEASLRALAWEDLDAILVWDDTKPPSWHLDNLVSNPSQVLAIPARSVSDEAWVALPAFRDLAGGRYTDFTGEDAVFMSWGTVYSSVGGARDAYAAIADELAGDDGWGLGRGDTVDLGDGGVLYTGTTTKAFGRQEGEAVATRMYLWRTGNAVLAVGGWFDYDAAELDAVALSMDERADSASGAR